jgi:hypothetical protein
MKFGLYFLSHFVHPFIFLFTAETQYVYVYRTPCHGFQLMFSRSIASRAVAAIFLAVSLQHIHGSLAVLLVPGSGHGQ